jgi:O-antigen/teichoic acid export membrane protein
MSFTRNVAIYAAADILGAGIGLITSPITTRLLTQEQYGVLPLLSAVWAVVALVQYAGMDWAFPFFRSRRQEGVDKVLASATMLATLSGIMVWGLFFLVNTLTPWLRDYARVSVVEQAIFMLGLLPGAVLNWYLYILRYENQAMAFARISLLGRTLSTLLALPAMFLAPQEWRLIVNFGVNAFVSMLAVAWALRELRIAELAVYDRNAWSNDLSREMLRYGMLLVPGGMVYSMSTVVDRLLVGWFVGPQGNAILALTAAIGGTALLLKQWFARAWDPKMIEWVRTKDPAIYLPKLQIVINILLLGLLPLPLFAMLWMEPVIHLLYPAQYAPVSPLIPALISAGVISTFSLVAVATALISNTARWHFPIYSLALLINTVIGLITIPIIGVKGAIFATLAGEFFILLSWIAVGIQYYGNLKLRWGLCLVLLGTVALITCTYYPGIWSQEYKGVERLVGTIVVTVAWGLGWRMLQPLRAWKMLRMDASGSTDAKIIAT